MDGAYLDKIIKYALFTRLDRVFLFTVLGHMPRKVQFSRGSYCFGISCILFGMQVPSQRRVAKCPGQDDYRGADDVTQDEPFPC